MLTRTKTLGVLLLAAAVLVPASTVARLSLRELSARAHRLAAGRIERITSYQDPQSGRILSRVEISEARLGSGGAAPSSFVFEMTGGTVGGIRQWIAGFPPLRAGDRVVLLLAEDTLTPLGPTVGLWQGVFFVEADAASGVDVVTDHLRRPISEIRDGELVTSAGGRRLPLTEFFSRLAAWRSTGRASGPRQ